MEQLELPFSSTPESLVRRLEVLSAKLEVLLSQRLGTRLDAALQARIEGGRVATPVREKDNDLA